MKNQSPFRMFPCVCGLFIAVSLAATDRAGADRPEQKPAGTEHTLRNMAGWKVEVDRQLIDGKHEKLGRQALRILAGNLYNISLVVPEKQLARLRQVPIRMEAEHPLENLQYHPDSNWLKEHGYDPALEKTVHIPRARRLVNHNQHYTQPWSVLHELAHAYHDQFLGFDDPAIRKAFKRVVDNGRFKSVLRIDGTRQRHYALTNYKEFFAEMTEAYFGTNDFYPFVRGELSDCNPKTYTLLESIWSGAYQRPAVAEKP